MKAFAHAKLNLCLRVLGRRVNGFHDISSLMCSVDLADALEVEARPDGTNTLAVSGGDAGPDLQNLALKAARVFQETIGSETCGFEISLEKRIPAGAGLGGGSADAAAVLHLANLLSGADVDVTKLSQIGRQIGSDVPFCVVGGLARVESSGEVVESLAMPAGLLESYFLIAVPEFWMSTGDVYAAYDSLGKCGEESEPPPQLAGIVDVFVNDLEPAAEWLAPPLKKLRRRFSAILGSPARMTGSGSALFGILGSLDEAKAASKDASKLFERVFICRPSKVGVTIVDR